MHQLSAITADIGTIRAGVLVAQSGLSELNLNRNYIIFNNGITMKVIGDAFGTSNQFVEWFGPSMDPSLCSESNAVSYESVEGGAYFGGTLAAGIICNRNRATSIATDAFVSVGPFLTNGATKTVVVSYAYRYAYTCDTWTGSASGSGAAQLVIERSTDNEATWTQIGTLAASGAATVTVDGEPGVPDAVELTITGSTTLTDNTAATSTMSLRARLASRSSPTLGGQHGTAPQITQTISIVETEQ